MYRPLSMCEPDSGQDAIEHPSDVLSSQALWVLPSDFKSAVVVVRVVAEDIDAMALMLKLLLEMR